MNGVPNSFGGWMWFFLTAIVLAVAVNIGSDYLKPKVDRYLEGYSTSRKITNEKGRQQLEERVTELLNDPTEVSFLLHNIALAERLILFFILLFMILVAIINTLSISDGNVPYSFSFFSQRIKIYSLIKFVLYAVTLIQPYFVLVSSRIWSGQQSILQAYKEAKRKQASEDSAHADSTNGQEEAEKTTAHSSRQPGLTRDAPGRVK